MKAEPKPTYAAIPGRAIGDERLTALDLRVLMAVAIHDRLKANGAGCYASHSRLASLVGCHLKSLSRSMRTLAEAGYLIGRQNPLNAKTRIYNVVYSDFDAQYLKAGGVGIGNEPVTYSANETAISPPPIGNQPVTDEPAIGNEAVTQIAPIGNRSVAKNPMIGNRVEKNTQQNQRDASRNIFCEAVIHPVETEKILLKQRLRRARGLLRGSQARALAPCLG